ncbi:glutamine synthetase [Branchiibius hedensis]|uniref:Glutamine synthetase n=1 Tax=Branchiibius hedensis TaxID=672460 RepID=A0A2Y8ZU04_9MICO|nr:glutamine synthetase family protein [Branchiibius hedensis]PWJ24943.1 glutamine synthetase [Branchiibius hedensis]SSA33759.1 glutamine synthetase [Branchiibius hedensis]
MVSDSSALSAQRAELAAAGVRFVAGWATNASNLVHAKTMPLERFADFVTSGAGMSPVYNGYSLDASIQFTPYYGAVGDLRLRLVPETVRLLGDGLAIGATRAVDQDGAADPCAPRNILERVVAEAIVAGFTPLIGHELEFTLVNPDGSLIEVPSWTPYGLGPVIGLQGFVDDLISQGAVAGVSFEQVHAEYGAMQIEVSLPPAEPVVAADTVVVAKTVIGRVARKHGMLPSFSPVPIDGGVGNGAHQHFSLSRGDQSIFAGGSGARGMTPQGESAIAGVLHALPEAQAVFAGSVLSGTRLAPGFWSGATACWGTENREASVRFLQGGSANPHGANVEVKIIDPSANPYLASAAILGLAVRGVASSATLPPEITEDPSGFSDEERAAAGLLVLPSDHRTVLDAFEGSELMREILGPQSVAALLAVRRHENDVYGEVEASTRSETLRLAWTV